MEQLEKLKEFRELGLGEKVLKVLSKKGYESPTPIQRLTIPALLKNDKDIIGQAQTGTGKTAAFSLPIIENFENLEHIQAIVLTPTRELALQVAEEMNSLSTSKKMKVIPVYGGQSIDIHRKLIKTGVDVVVGTPGRVWICQAHNKRETSVSLSFLFLSKSIKICMLFFYYVI